MNEWKENKMLQPEPQENQQSCNKVNVFKPIYLRIFHSCKSCQWKNPNQSHEIPSLYATGFRCFL